MKNCPVFQYRKSWVIAAKESNDAYMKEKLPKNL